MSLPKYENRDFFCAQKREVPVEEATKTSEELYEWCREEVMKSVKAYKLDHLEVPETREEVNKQLNKLEEDEYNEEKELKPF
jgi:hypothetical protein